MFGKRTLRVGAIAAAVALPMAVAATTPATAAEKPNTATVSVLHGIPGAVLASLGVAGGVVDVCANGSVELIPDFAPGELKTLKVAPGTYTLTVHAGAAGCSSQALLTKEATVEAGKNYTVTANLFLTGGTPSVAPALNVFVNNQAPLAKTRKQAMKNGQGRITVRHIAAAPPVSVYLGTTEVNPGAPLANGSQIQDVLKKGTYQASAGLAGAGIGAIAVGPEAVKIRQGWNTIVYAWGVPAGTAGSTGYGIAYQYVKLNLPKK
jgi:hypothetical protein